MQNHKSWQWFERPKTYWLFIAIVVASIYGRTINYTYNLDDYLVVEDLKMVQDGFTGIKEIFTSPYILEKDVRLDYRPMARLSFAIETALFGENTSVYHLFNLVYFFLFLFLCYHFLHELIEHTRKRFFIGIMVLFIAIHPLLTEIVCSLKNREELLAGIFLLLAGIFSLRSAKQNKLIYTFLAGIFLFLGLLSKLSVLPFFGFVIILLLFKKTNKKLLALNLVSYLIACLVFALLFFKISINAQREIIFIEAPQWLEGGLLTHISLFLSSMGFYFSKILVPVKQACYYGYNTIPFPQNIQVYSLLGLLSLAAFAYMFYVFRKDKNILLALIFSLIMMSMFFNTLMPYMGIVGERSALFGIVGMVWALVLVSATVIEKKATYRKYFVYFALMLCVLFTAKSFARVSDWKERVVLYESDVKSQPNSAKLQYLYAKELRRIYQESKSKDDLMKSKQAYVNAIKIWDKYDVAYEELGMIYAIDLNQIDSASIILQKAIACNDKLWKSHYNLSRCYLMENKKQEAIHELEKTLELEPSHTRSYGALAQLYLEENMNDTYKSLMLKQMTVDNQNPAPYENLAYLQLKEQDTLAAVKNLEAAVQLKSNNRAIYQFLQGYYLAKHDSSALNKLYLY